MWLLGIDVNKNTIPSHQIHSLICLNFLFGYVLFLQCCCPTPPPPQKKQNKRTKQARTQYTPRANFDETGITSIIKPASDGSVPYNEKVALYDGPDAHNPCFDVPDDAIDVYDIVAGRRRRRHLADTTNTTRSVSSSVLVEEGEVTVKVEGGQHRILKSPLSQYSQKSRSANIITGLGWQVVDEPQGYCDGTYNAVCGRDTDSSCVLYGHHDS